MADATGDGAVGDGATGDGAVGDGVPPVHEEHPEYVVCPVTSCDVASPALLLYSDSVAVL